MVELLARGVDLCADLLDLALEDQDVRDAAVDGVSDARVRLVRERVGGVPAQGLRYVVEDLGGVAGAEDFVHAGELGGVVRREVRREDAHLRALAAQQLARRARRDRRRHGSSIPSGWRRVSGLGARRSGPGTARVCWEQGTSDGRTGTQFTVIYSDDGRTGHGQPRH